VPIIDYIDDSTDRQLISLMDYLKKLNEANDIRIFNQSVFKFDQYPKMDYGDDLAKLIQEVYLR